MDDFYGVSVKAAEHSGNTSLSRRTYNQIHTARWAFVWKSVTSI